MAEKQEDSIPWYQKGLDILGESAGDLVKAKVKQQSDKWTNSGTHQQTSTPQIVDEYGNNVPYPLRTRTEKDDFFDKHKELILYGGAGVVGLILIVAVLK